MVNGKIYSSNSVNGAEPYDIPTSLYGISASSAMMMRDEIHPGTYVGVRNQNNLSEINIYRKNEVLEENVMILGWDGSAVNTNWFTNEEQEVYEIATGEELRGLAFLVNNGVTFEGKLIRLGSDINLNYREWTPIGCGYEAEQRTKYGEKYIHITAKNPFKGVFDGCGHTVYGLRISDAEPNKKFSGLFGCIEDATIKNIVLEQVRVGVIGEDTSYAAVCGHAKSSMFSNVIVSGVIRGESCSSIVCISVDTSFYNCINRANLICRSDVSGKNLLVGGIVQQVGLSEKMAEMSYTQSPDLFIKCIQAGTITVQVGEARQFWGGQLYGTIIPSSDGYSITINRCDAQVPMIVEMNNIHGDTKCVFCGVTPTKEPICHIGPLIGCKIDLLNGLIGKTPMMIKVRVNKITRSTVIDRMVIQGSVNVLESEYHTNTFRTIDINEINSTDGIEVLEPYFTYVMTKNI